MIRPKATTAETALAMLSVLRRQGIPVAVLDAKHIVMRGTPAADLIQQVLTYGAVLGLDEAWLVYPAARGQIEGRRRWRVARPGQSDFSVWTAPLRLWSGLDTATRDVHDLAKMLGSRSGVDAAS